MSSKKPFIELVWQDYEPKKLVFPVAFQQKFDGVPLRIINVGGNILAYTRQGEQISVVKHLTEELKYILIEPGSSVTGECYIPGKDFKEISGMVRQKQMQKPELNYYVFDFDVLPSIGGGWLERRNTFVRAFSTFLEVAGKAQPDSPVKAIPTVLCRDVAEVDHTFKLLLTAFPACEGAVVHSISKLYEPGERRALTQKIKEVPTIDLLVTGFEEAINAKTGEGNGMVGRIIAQLSRMQPSADGSTKLVTTEIGIGPGALKHVEREMLWRMQRQGKFKPRIAEIRYMRDDSYSSLRQPTFVQWRPDKGKPDTSK